MKFYQLFKIIDAASLGLSEEEHSIILETFLVSDEVLDRVLDFDDEGLRKRKKRGKKNTQHMIESCLYSRKNTFTTQVKKKNLTIIAGLGRSLDFDSESLLFCSMPS